MKRIDGQLNHEGEHRIIYYGYANLPINLNYKEIHNNKEMLKIKISKAVFVNDFFNIDLTNNTYKYYPDITDMTTYSVFTIPENIYNPINDLLTIMNNQTPNLQWGYNSTTHKITVTNLTLTTSLIDAKFYYLLGFNNLTSTHTFNANIATILPKPINLNSIDFIQVKSTFDINNMYNGKYSNLFTVIPITGDYNESCYYQNYEDKGYTFCNQDALANFTLDFHDQDNNQVTFQSPILVELTVVH